MDNAKIYYEDKNLTIAYNPAMDGYWLNLKEKHSERNYNDFLDQRVFEDLMNSDEKGKLGKLLTLNSNVFLGLKNTEISHNTLFNAIEVVKLKEEKEFEEFKKSNNL